MELIRLFLGILFIICLSFTINLKNINDFIVKKNLFNESIEASSPLGLCVVNFKGRVKIADVLDYTPAKSAGLEPGDRILQVNGCKINDVKSFYESIEEADSKSPIKLVVHRTDSCSTFPVDIKPFETLCK